MDNTLYRGEPHVLLCPINVATQAGIGNPFSGLNKVVAQAVAAATLIGVLRPPDNAPLMNNQGGVGLFAGVANKPKHVRIIADGILTTWTATLITAFTNLNDDAGALTNVNRLRTVITINGRITRQRVQSTVALTGNDYRTKNNAAVMELSAEKSGGGAYGAGTIIDVYMLEAGDVVQQAVSILPIEVDAYDFMVSSTSAVLLSLPIV
jgi:hypothetical protein